MPHVVVHPARQPQLSHGGVDQRVACSPSLPGLEVASVATPSQSLRAPAYGRQLVSHVSCRDKRGLRSSFRCQASVSRESYLIRRSEGLPRQVGKQAELPVSQVPPRQLALELEGSAARPLGVPQKPAWAQLSEMEVRGQTAGVWGVRPARLFVVPVHT